MAPRRVAMPVVVALVALTAIGLAAWFLALVRPAPQVPAAIVRSVVAGPAGVVFTVDAGPPGDRRTFERAGLFVKQVGRRIATGALRVGAGQAVTIAFAPSPGARPMRLVFDPGILAAGTVSGGSPDHLLGLAGLGSAWPGASAAASAYCAPFEIGSGVFCKHVMDAAPPA